MEKDPLYSLQHNRLLIDRARPEKRGGKKVNTVNFHYDTHKIVNSFSLLVVFSILGFHVISKSRLLTVLNFYVMHYIRQTSPSACGVRSIVRSIA